MVVPDEKLVEDGENLGHERWVVLRKVAGGGFGQIYEAEDQKLSIRVAVKVEPFDDPKSVLRMEVIVLRRLQNSKHICNYYGVGATPRINYLVMSLCGRNLSEIRRTAPHMYFSMSTSVRITAQAIEAIEDLHNAGFLHRDIKPSNFALGALPQDPRAIYLLDFGLCRMFVNLRGHHRTPRAAANFRGTVRYASLTAHRSREMGRVDDLWSLFYMLVEFLRGQLPWKRLRDKDEAKRYKERYVPRDLVQSMPDPIVKFVEALEALTYSDRPDYEKLRGMLLNCTHTASSYPYDWENDFKDVKNPNTYGPFRRYGAGSDGEAHSEAELSDDEEEYEAARADFDCLDYPS